MQKKIPALFVFGVLFFLAVMPVSRAAEGAATETDGMSGAPQEMANLQKTLGDERMDNLEQSVAELRQELGSLSERVQDLERTVDDFNSRL
jgi:flagellar biosynthesis/type III secretory pathway M-ring protein FliF/YscJ